MIGWDGGIEAMGMGAVVMEAVRRRERVRERISRGVRNRKS